MRRLVELKENEIERMNQINNLHEEAVGAGEREELAGAVRFKRTIAAGEWADIGRNKTALDGVLLW